jgi:hypothetical protein
MHLYIYIYIYILLYCYIVIYIYYAHTHKMYIYPVQFSYIVADIKTRADVMQACLYTCAFTRTPAHTSCIHRHAP